MAKRRTRPHRREATVLQREVGRRVKEARDRGGRSQTELAEVLGLSRTSVSNLERGKHRVFVDQVYVAANWLSVTLPDLLPPISQVFLPDGLTAAADDPLPPGAAAEAENVVKSVREALAVYRSDSVSTHKKPRAGS